MSDVLNFQVNGSSPSTVGGTGTSVKYFQRILGTNGPNGGANTNISASNAAGALMLPAANVFNGQAFEVVAAGSFGSDTGDPSGTVTISLYAVTGSVGTPTYTAIAGTGAITPAYAAAESWAIRAQLYGESKSGVLGGNFYAGVRGLAVNSSPKDALALITGLDFNAGNPSLQQGAVLGFVVGVTFGTSDSTNTASMTQFLVRS